MKKEKLNLPYNGAELEIIKFETCDIVTTSGDGSGEVGGTGGDNYGWT